jgi:hypothetical protein
MSEIVNVAGVPTRTARVDASSNNKNLPSVPSIAGQLAPQGCWDGEDFGDDK